MPDPNEPGASGVPRAAEALPIAGEPDGGPSLFERLGGRGAVERIVARFYSLVEGDPILRPIFPADLTPGREKQTLFMEQWLGGEPRYSRLYGHPRLRLRHFPFVIDERAAGRWLRLFAQAMREEGVEEALASELLARLGPLAHHMVNADGDVPREPLGERFLQ